VTTLEILTYPNQVLRKPCQPVENIDGVLQNIFANMATAMYGAPGVGLAAIQVGIDQSFLIYDVSGDSSRGDFKVLINPKIVDQFGQVISEDEGCLSVPEYRANVKRFESILVQGIDRDGNPLSLEADGFLSIVLQHEVDHLHGKLFIDHISSLKRQLFKKWHKKHRNNP